MNEIINLDPILKKYLTNIYGLSFFPSLEPHFSSDRDGCISGDLRLCFNPPLCLIDYKQEVNVTERAYNKVVEVVKAFKRDIFVLEIGVDRESTRTFTEGILSNKTPNSTYLGVDIEDKSNLNSPPNNIFTLKTDSRNQDYVRNYIKYDLGAKNIDVLMIDGFHSVNCTINDFKYADLLSEDGVVLVHDSNGHEGPLALIEAINKNMFNVENLFQEFIDEYGLCLITKKR